MESQMKCRWLVCFAVFLLVVFIALVSSAQVSPGASFYQKALQEMKAGNYNEALVQIQSALAQSPEQLEFQYELGVIYFNLGRLDESEGIFQALVHQDEALFGKAWFDLAHIANKRGKRLEAIEFLEKARPADPGRADLEAGIACLELKDYQKAVDSFKNAQSERPELMFQATVYESAALAKQKKYDESLKLLESLLKTKLTQQENDLVSYLLTVLKADERSAKRWHLSGSAGFIYDTNLTLNPVAPVGIQHPSGIADFAQTSSITGRYDLVRNDPWTFGAGYNHYNLTYFEHPNESVLAASPLFYGYWNNPPYFASLEYTYDHYWAGESSKADVHSISPVFAFNATQTWRTTILGWAAWREFYDTTPNDQLYGVGVIEYYLMRKGLAHLRAGVLWGEDLTTPEDAGSFSSTQFTAGFQWPVWKDKWFIDVSGFYIIRDYRFNPAYFTDVSRTDNEKDLYVALRGPLSNNVQIVFLFQRVWNDSNINVVEIGGSYEPFTYERAIFSCLLTFDF